VTTQLYDLRADCTEYDVDASNVYLVDVLPFAGVTLIVAIGSEITTSKLFSTVFPSLS
jgi:hypothetical protein